MKASLFHSHRELINKSALTLVEILKQELPDNWSNFIPELCESANTSLNICEVTMIILKLLAEEVFDFAEEHMTRAKTLRLRESMSEEFQLIFNLCFNVLRQPAPYELQNLSLSCLQEYLIWIYLSPIQEGDLIELLLSKFLKNPQTSVATLRCLNELANHGTSSTIISSIPKILNELRTVVVYVPTETKSFNNIPNSNIDGEILSQECTTTLTNILAKYRPLLERNKILVPILVAAHEDLIQLSERNIKLSLRYWCDMASDIYTTEEQSQIQNAHNSSRLHNYQTNMNLQESLRIYEKVFNDLAVLIIENMEEPPELIFMEDEVGQNQYEHNEETQETETYNLECNIIIYLTHFNRQNIELIILDELEKLRCNPVWSEGKFSSLCWAIGVIFKTCKEDFNDVFTGNVIDQLTKLVEKRKDESDELLCDLNFIYTIREYPRFLNHRFGYLKEVIIKLLEIMRTHEEIYQNRASDYFFKIVQDCRHEFQRVYPQEPEPLISWLITYIEPLFANFGALPQYKIAEACAVVINDEDNSNRRDELLQHLMCIPENLESNLNGSEQSYERLFANTKTITTMTSVIRFNRALCSSLGGNFYPQFKILFPTSLQKYEQATKLLAKHLQNSGTTILSSAIVRS